MFRRFIPALLILVLFLLDSTVMPIIYTGVYGVPLTVVAVFLIGMVLGRMRGLLYGTLGGLLLDITTGTLGVMTYFLMFVGFMIGLIVYVPGERILPSRRKRQRRILWRAAWVLVLYVVGEVAILVIQYFNTAEFEWVYLLNILIRGAVCTLMCTLLRPPFARLLTGQAAAGSTANRSRAKAARASQRTDAAVNF